MPDITNRDQTYTYEETQIEKIDLSNETNTTRLILRSILRNGILVGVINFGSNTILIDTDLYTPIIKPKELRPNPMGTYVSIEDKVDMCFNIWYRINKIDKLIE